MKEPWFTAVKRARLQLCLDIIRDNEWVTVEGELPSDPVYPRRPDYRQCVDCDGVHVEDGGRGHYPACRVAAVLEGESDA